MNQFIISGDNTNIKIKIKDYERKFGSEISDLNWLLGDLEAKIGCFYCNYSISITTYDINNLIIGIEALFSNEKLMLLFEPEEENIIFSINKDHLGNYVIKGSLQNNQRVNALLQFEFKSDETYLKQMLCQLKMLTKKFKIIRH